MRLIIIKRSLIKFTYREEKEETREAAAAAAADLF